MNNVRRLSIAVVAIALTVVLVSLQLAWNLHTTDYLRDVARRSDTYSQVASVLPDYAARKLPNPAEAQKVFAKQVTSQTVSVTANGLYSSISDAYNGRTDIVAFSLDPIIEPVLATGYQIPPGTELANKTIQINGLAGVLRNASRALGLSLIVLAISAVIMFLLNIKRGPLRPARSAALLAGLILGGLYLAMWALPSLVGSLVASSGLDPSLQSILLTYLSTITKDSANYYLAMIIALILVATIISILRVLTGRSHKSNKPHDSNKTKGKKSKPLLDEPAFKEL